MKDYSQILGLFRASFWPEIRKYHAAANHEGPKDKQRMQIPYIQH